MNDTNDMSDHSEQSRAREQAVTPARPESAARPELINREIVARVSDRVAHGLSLQLALAAEDHPDITEAIWSQAVKRNPRLASAPETAKAKFCEEAVRRLANHEDNKWLCWLLERRYADLFSRSGDTANNAQTVAGIPEDIMERAREKAAKKRREEF